MVEEVWLSPVLPLEVFVPSSPFFRLVGLSTMRLVQAFLEIKPLLKINLN